LASGKSPMATASSSICLANSRAAQSPLTQAAH
jgi:hypothetical protein